ncbi:hypothetical protein [Modestobacter marinus]|uniref:hypothetical protein n=1 Tax=Modestobacter marinus TaxID=477641 RepID=UPI001C939BFF|nr:hypothetical protein [Modestobacter marinus]
MSEQGATGPRNPADLAAQMRAAAERMMAGWTAAAGGSVPGQPPATPPGPGFVMPTMPATMTGRQMEAVLDDLSARRAQVQALVAQLQAFDEQLATLETNLRPFLAWTRKWAGVESAMADFWRPLTGGSEK